MPTLENTDLKIWKLVGDLKSLFIFELLSPHPLGKYIDTYIQFSRLSGHERLLSASIKLLHRSHWIKYEDIFNSHRLTRLSKFVFIASWHRWPNLRLRYLSAWFIDQESYVILVYIIWSIHLNLLDFRQLFKFCLLNIFSIYLFVFLSYLFDSGFSANPHIFLSAYFALRTLRSAG